MFLFVSNGTPYLNMTDTNAAQNPFGNGSNRGQLAAGKFAPPYINNHLDPYQDLFSPQSKLYVVGLLPCHTRTPLAAVADALIALHERLRPKSCTATNMTDVSEI